MPNRKKSMAELQNAITPEKELLCRTLLGQRRLRSIYIGRDIERELLARTRELLEEIRAPARWLREVTKSARVAKACRALAIRLSGK